MSVLFSMVNPVGDAVLGLDKALVGFWRVIVLCHYSRREKKVVRKTGALRIYKGLRRDGPRR